MNDTQLLELLATTDAYAADATLPESVWSHSVALAEIERRKEMADTKTREPMTPIPQRKPRRAWLAAAAAFLIAVVAGVVIAVVSRSPEAPPAGPTSTTSTTEATTPTTGTASESTPLTTSFGSVEIGTYRLNTFEPSITFTVDPSFFFVQQNTTNRLALSAPNSRDPGDRDMVVERLDRLSDPATPNASVPDQVDGWPTNDFPGWLDNLTDGVIVVNRADTTVGGLPATRAELKLGDIECHDDRYCALLGWRGVNYTPLLAGSTHVVWAINDGSDEPLFVIVNIINERDRAWIDSFENLLSTFTFGE